MILSFRNISAVCAVFLLVSVSSFQKSAIANINHQSQLIAQQSKTQPHPVFKSILPKLKQKTQIKILLPKFIPESDGENPIYANIETATQKNYEILLAFSPDCYGASACRLGVVSAEAVTRKTPGLNGKRVSLAKGFTGYFVDFTCGAGCSDATLTWRQQGVQYVVGLKAGDRTSLVKMANSAINP
ncbi:hypothetical protein [Nostoc sp. 'Peltigera membranacea cyanobiont' N6]|uniref:hypothetical protein n=1 Tax=Nostoc sp. 'Peltigera membranacea cyanobiont' N6 TaxID=1261031 RepID=UPI000CF318EE|nr:hypothetical protein [Nostoc sp. 'Peltigera membranacea cyanobiont' N6]AVH65907.1 hypothetical protein NPM_4372 [Nostoc sp. 'Peltigera membranacea cyanobiont' N6]